MTSIACKVTLNNETRRVLLESTRDTTFNKLNQVVRELFNQKLPSMMQGMMPPGMMPPSSGNDEEEPEDMREMIQMVCSRDQELHRLSQKTTIKNSLNTYFSITDANERKEVLQTLLQDNEFKSFFEKVNEKLEQLSMANMMGGMMGNDGNNPFYGMGGPGSGMGRGGSGGGPNMMFT